MSDCLTCELNKSVSPIRRILNCLCTAGLSLILDDIYGRLSLILDDLYDRLSLILDDLYGRWPLMLDDLYGRWPLILDDLYGKFNCITCKYLSLTFVSYKFFFSLSEIFIQNIDFRGVMVTVFNATFNNISVISWWSVLLSHNVVSSTPRLNTDCNGSYKAHYRTITTTTAPWLECCGR